MKQPIEVARVNADVNVGLNAEQVKERVDAHKTNYVKKVVGKSYFAIFASNIFTFFNLLGIIIFILMLICQSIENMFFFVVILANTALGIFQEIRSKLAIEKLSLVNQPTSDVMRDGELVTISTDKIVLDDIVKLSQGKQIGADGVVVEGMVEVDESMLTGESDPVKKNVGDELFAGSYVVSGTCVYRVEKVGMENYIQKLSAEVKKFKKPNSELMRSITSIIKVISWIIFPLGLATFLKNNTVLDSWQEALKSASGSMIGMVPSGMVLLTSVALAVGVIKLSRRKVLVRELYCIEMLARVDTLCMDKTGTITDGTMTVDSVNVLNNEFGDVEHLIASTVTATQDDNLTAKALKKRFSTNNPLKARNVLAFSSQRKFSAANFEGVGTIAIGAGEFMVKNPSQQYLDMCNSLLSQGLRVLTIAHSYNNIENDKVENLVPIAIVALQDTLRPDAVEIVKWFKDNNVEVKVISGDNPLSVSVIAGKVGVENAYRYISLDGLTDEQVEEAATQYTVFGRVTPHQKALLVKAMKKHGRTVAMTGDGVNDILAMRESDCAISVGAGTDAARSVAHLVLQDNKFGSMPNVVAEGRQVVNNIQNSSSLFLMKTSMTVLTTILLFFLPQYAYPFEAQNLYAIEFFVIGIPSFLLALKPNRNIIRGKFIVNTMKNTLPSGVAMFLSVAMTYAFSNVTGIAGNSQQITTVAMFSMTATGVLALWILLYPYGWVNVGIGAIGTVGTVGCLALFPLLLQFAADLMGSGEVKPMYVDIPTGAMWFVAINAIVMAALIICGKLIIAHIEKRKAK